MMREGFSSNKRGTSILIADDHEVARRGFRSILESEPDLHVVGEASDGLEAIEMAKTFAPGIVLMDIGMPELNGMMATRLLQEELPNVLVLIVTMHYSEELLREAMHAGAKGYLLKTDADRELITAIRCLSRRKLYFSPRFGDCWDEDALAAALHSSTQLTEREREILKMLAEGHNNQEVAVLLGISVKTIETHRVSMMRKINAHSLSELVRYAIRNGIIQA